MLLGGILALIESHWGSLGGRLRGTWLYLGGPWRQKVIQSCTKGDEADIARTLKNCSVFEVFEGWSRPNRHQNRFLDTC